MYYIVTYQVFPYPLPLAKILWLIYLNKPKVVGLNFINCFTSKCFHLCPYNYFVTKINPSLFIDLLYVTVLSYTY